MAATYIWTGGGTDNNWSTCANWGGTCPISSDTVTFNGTSTKDSTVDSNFGGTVTILNISSGYAGTISLARSLTVSSTMSQAAGTFTAGGNDLTVASTFTLSGGVFNAPSTTFHAQGNFTHSGGTFNHSSGTVNLDGLNQTIAGSTTFYNLTKAQNTFVLTITAGTTQTVTNTLSLSGKTPMTRLFLRSSSAGTVWNIDAQGSTRTISNVDVQDSVNLNSTPIVADSGSKDAGHNTGWTFPSYQLPPKVVDYADPNNWHIRYDGPAGSHLPMGAFTTADIYGTGHQDIIVSAPGGSSSGISRSGSIYIIPYTLYSQITGRGNVVDLDNPESYALRIDGPVAVPSGYDSFGGFGALKVQDVTGDGRADLLISNIYESKIYVLYNDLIRARTVNPTGNIISVGHKDSEDKYDNFNLRLGEIIPNSPVQGATLAPNTIQVGKYIGVANLTGDSPDITIAAPFTGFNGYASGSFYIIGGSIIKSKTGLGNIVDLNSSSNYTLRIDCSHAFRGVTGYYMADGAGDLDSDGKDDLIIGVKNIDDTRRYPNESGGVFLLYNTFLSQYLHAPGHTIDLGSAEKPYNIMFKTGLTDGLGENGTYNIADLNNDGKKWFIMGGAMFSSHERRTWNGSVYVFPYSMLKKYTGTGNDVDVTRGSNYFLRIDGADNNHLLGDMFTTVQDYFGTGKKDLLTGGPKAPSENQSVYGPNDFGWIYVIPSSKIVNQPHSSGNIMDMADTSNYAVLYTGAQKSANATIGIHLIATMSDVPIDVDLNGDGTHDMIFGAHFASYSNGTDAGALYIAYNFPHTITASLSGNKIQGAVSTQDSPTTVAKVQYSVDNRTATASTWKDCTGTTSYSCTLPSLSGGRHTIYVRAKDSSGIYTVQSHYATTSITVAQSPVITDYTTIVVTTLPTPTTEVTPTLSPTTNPDTVHTTTPTSSNSAAKPTNNLGLCFGVLIIVPMLFLIFWLGRKKKKESS